MKLPSFIVRNLNNRFSSIALSRPPDFIVGDGYLGRWYVLPRNRFVNIYLHCFRGSDDDRALHDHPWWSLSLLLDGTLIEHTIAAGGCFKQKRIERGNVVLRRARSAHRLELVGADAWTLFITGPRLREWGFHCTAGWVDWRKFVDERDTGKVGAGCAAAE